MSNELMVSTPEDYVRLTTKLVSVTSGAVFSVRAMNASSMVYLLSVMPEGGFVGNLGLYEFVKEHFVDLVKYAIQPNVVAPKLDDDQLFFLDVVDLLTGLMDISGFDVGDS